MILDPDSRQIDLFVEIFFVLFLVILQQLEGNIIYPRVVGSSVGLPGVLFGVPLAATVYQLLKQQEEAS